MSVLDPTRLSQALQTRRSTEDADLQTLLLELLGYHEPVMQVYWHTIILNDLETNQLVIQPPTAEDEWIVNGIIVSLLLIRDNLDTLDLIYEDTYSTANLSFYRATHTINGGSSTFTWPTGQGGTTAMVSWKPLRPLILYRKPNGDLNKAIMRQFTTTATLGTRTVTTNVIYQQRRRLH